MNWLQHFLLDKSYTLYCWNSSESWGIISSFHLQELKESHACKITKLIGELRMKHTLDLNLAKMLWNLSPQKSETIVLLIHGIFTVLRINCDAFLVSEGLRKFLLQLNC